MIETGLLNLVSYTLGPEREQVGLRPFHRQPQPHAHGRALLHGGDVQKYERRTNELLSCSSYERRTNYTKEVRQRQRGGVSLLQRAGWSVTLPTVGGRRPTTRCLPPAPASAPASIVMPGFR
jgi:hypothetical protein